MPPKQVAINLKTDIDTEDKQPSKPTSVKSQKKSSGLNIGSKVKSSSLNNKKSLNKIKRKVYPTRLSASIHAPYCDIIFSYTNSHHICLSLI